MKKLRFKNRNGWLSYGIGDKFVAAGVKYNNINKNIFIKKFKDGQLNEDLGLGENVKIPSVKELLQEVMLDKEKRLKHKTLLAYRISCNSKIIPYFGDKLITNIKPIDIKKFQDSMIDNGLGVGSVNIARVLLKDVFEIAILKELVTSNMVKMVSVPKTKRKKKEQLPFTLEEIDTILENAPEELRNFLGILFFTGMRSGELLALTWEDIDFSTDTISISKTVAEGYINSAKTASSERDIEMLDKAKEYFKKQQFITGLQGSYLFLNYKKTHYTNNAWFYTNFKKLLEKCGINQRSLHNTRHTFASLMLNNGIDPLWVSRTLGHNNLHVTLKIYTHYMPKKEKMKIEFLEKRYKSGTNGF